MVRCPLFNARPKPSFEGPESFGAPSLVNHDVTIRNARSIVDSLSLDREGFALIKHEMACANERDLEVLSSKYLEEMAGFIKSRFNASWVTHYQQGAIKPVIIRSPDGSYGRQPSRLAHVDFSSVAGPVVAAISDQEQGIRTRAYSRMMIIQTWRALSPPSPRFPASTLR